jgi:hypothetical protein
MIQVYRGNFIEDQSLEAIILLFDHSPINSFISLGWLSCKALAAVTLHVMRFA